MTSEFYKYTLIIWSSLTPEPLLPIEIDVKHDRNMDEVALEWLKVWPDDIVMLVESEQLDGLAKHGHSPNNREVG